MELENNGGEGSAGSHWERTTMHNELMTASAMLIKTSYSAFTMAVLEDSGWYKANYQRAGTYVFGRNKGCEIL